MERILVGLLMGVILCLASCSTLTETRSRWVVPGEDSRKDYQKIYVVVILPSADAVGQLENALVEKLKKSGVDAVASSSMVPSAGSLSMVARDQIVESVKASGADAVLVTSFIRTDKKLRIDGAAIRQPIMVPVPADLAYAAYIRAQGDAMVASPNMLSTRHHLRASLYQVADEKKVWEARSITFDPASLGSGVASYSSSIVEELRLAGAIGKYK